MKVFVFALYLMNVDGGAPHRVAYDLTAEECQELAVAAFSRSLYRLVCVPYEVKRL